MNGSTYCALDVSNDIVVGNPGYSYFLNGSVEFMGVRFVTWCPAMYVGCPSQSDSASQVQTALYAGVIRLNMTFPDKSNETIGSVIGDLTHLVLISKHTNPNAGISIQYVYDGHTSSYEVLLLVEDTGSPSS
jgi:hypothetical protein